MKGQLALLDEVILEPECLTLVDVDDTAVPELCAFGPKLRKIHDYLARFTMYVERGEERVSISLLLPEAHPLWTGEGIPWAPDPVTPR